MQDTAGEVRTNSLATFSYGPLHTDERGLDEQLDSIYYGPVRPQDVLTRENQLKVRDNTSKWRERIRYLRKQYDMMISTWISNLFISSSL